MQKTFVVLFGILFSGVSFAEVHGFIAPAYQWGTASGDRNGFVLQDAALYVSGKLGDIEYLVDLPFHSAGEAQRVEVSSGELVTTSEIDNSFNFATDQAQAYLSQSFKSGFSWKAGQFDGIYGYEAADAFEREFLRPGFLGDAVPVTHRGVLLGYEMGMVQFNGVVSNRANQSMSTASVRPDFGLRASFEGELFRGGLGGLYQSAVASSSYLIDVMLGATVGSLVFDAQFDYLKGNVWGLMGLASYVWKDSGSFSLRGEIGKNMSSKWSFAAGPKVNLTKNVTLYTQYTVSEDVSARLGKKHLLDLGATLQF